MRLDGEDTFMDHIDEFSVEEDVVEMLNDEEIRRKEESCPGCYADLGPEIEVLDTCPECGEEL